jgi:hypothetical protein
MYRIDAYSYECLSRNAEILLSTTIFISTFRYSGRSSNNTLARHLGLPITSMNNPQSNKSDQLRQQWIYSGDILFLLLLIGAYIIQKATCITQLAGRTVKPFASKAPEIAVTPVAFSFGWVACGFSLPSGETINAGFGLPSDRCKTVRTGIQYRAQLVILDSRISALVRRTPMHYAPYSNGYKAAWRLGSKIGA